MSSQLSLKALSSATRTTVINHHQQQSIHTPSSPFEPSESSKSLDLTLSLPTNKSSLICGDFSSLISNLKLSTVLHLPQPRMAHISDVQGLRYSRISASSNNNKNYKLWPVSYLWVFIKKESLSASRASRGKWARKTHKVRGRLIVMYWRRLVF